MDKLKLRNLLTNEVDFRVDSAGIFRDMLRSSMGPGDTVVGHRHNAIYWSSSFAEIPTVTF